MRSVVVAAVTVVLAATMHVHDNRMWKWEIVEGLRSGNEFNDFDLFLVVFANFAFFVYIKKDEDGDKRWEGRRLKISCSCLVLQSCE